jgi:hypothetical protein
VSNSASVQEGPAPDQLLIQIGTGYMLSAALHVAAKLGVAEQLAPGPRPVSDVAKAVGAEADGLYRILRALAMVGIFAETVPRTFALTPAAEFLQPGKPGSMRDLALFMTDPLHFRVHAEMLYSVQTGKPAGEKVVGMPVFKYLEQDEEESDLFNRAMTSFSASVVPAVLEAYDLGRIRTLVDVAGGHGEVLTSILRRYPDMKGVLFDLDHVIAGALPRIAAMGLQDRCRVESGDFFKGVPSGGDAYLMKHIIHDWDDERAAAIMRNIHTALEGNASGKLILLEAVLQSGNQPDLGKIIDLEMMVFPGGRERSADDFAKLFAQAGFELVSITPTQSPLCVIEARPKLDIAA